MIIQKSIRDVFSLTVTEALWKKTPAKALKADGIALQIIDGEDAFLIDFHVTKGFAFRTTMILQYLDLARKTGGKEHVRKSFLVTKLMLDYPDLLKYVMENR